MFWEGGRKAGIPGAASETGGGQANAKQEVNPDPPHEAPVLVLPGSSVARIIPSSVFLSQYDVICGVRFKC